jgi:hemerythrin
MTTQNSKYWSEDLVLGHTVIDGQHKALVALYEDLEEAISKGAGLEMLSQTLSFLYKYVLTHFNTEEQEMLRHDYPDFADHSLRHDKFKEWVFQFRDHVRSSPEDPNNIELARSIILNWVADHIMNIDRKFITYVKENKSSQPQEQFVMEAALHEDDTTVLKWEDGLEFGYPPIDEQHKKLFEYTQIIRNQGDQEIIRLLEIFGFLQSFVLEHFLMKNCL